MNRKFDPKVIIVGLLLIGIILFTDPSGKLLDKIMSYVKTGISGLVGLVFLGIVVLVLIIGIGGFLGKLFRKKETSNGIPFGEMQSAFRSILLPHGFEEDTAPQIGRAIISSFSRGKLCAGLHLEPMDAIFYIFAGSKENVDGKEIFSKDFSLEFTGSDDFKAQAISRLNDWLVKQNFK